MPKEGLAAETDSAAKQSSNVSARGPAYVDKLVARSNDDRFSSRDWKDEIEIKAKRMHSVDRRHECFKLLRDYDLVGMTRGQTIELLGIGQQLKNEPNVISYDIFSGPCGNAGSDNLELWFENDHVKQWRVARHELVSGYKGPSESWILTKEEKLRFLRECSTPR